MRVRLPPSAPKAKRERAAKRKFKSEAEANARTNNARLSPQTPSSRVTLFGAELGGAGSGQAQAYRDRTVRPRSRC